MGLGRCPEALFSLALAFLLLLGQSSAEALLALALALLAILLVLLAPLGCGLDAKTLRALLYALRVERLFRCSTILGGASGLVRVRLCIGGLEFLTDWRIAWGGFLTAVGAFARDGLLETLDERIFLTAGVKVTAREGLT